MENEVPEAIVHLGQAYLGGHYGLVKSAKKAAKIFKRAVELGNTQAMCYLGYLHQHGNGVKSNLKKAAQLYRMAADRGHAVSQFNLALFAEEAGDLDEARRLYALAAAQGDNDAKEALAGLMA